MRSLRWRLTIATATATALILGLCGITLDQSIRASLVAEFDGSLLGNARAMLPLIEQQGGKKIFLDQDLTHMPEFRRPARPQYFEVRDENTHKTAPSQSLGDSTLNVPSPVEETSVQAVTLPDGRPGRAVTIRFKPRIMYEQSEEETPTQHVFVFVKARDTIDLLNTLQKLRWLLLSICGGATIVSAALMAILIRRGLRSTDQLAARIAGIDDATLAKRVELTGVPIELMPVVNRLNDLLQRLEDAFTREKSFSADVAHELRTPLSGLETALEVAAQQRRPPEEYERVIVRCLDVSRRMHAMVDNLLTLARAESKQLIVHREPMDLAELCREAWSQYQPRARRAKAPNRMAQRRAIASSTTTRKKSGCCSITSSTTR